MAGDFLKQAEGSEAGDKTVGGGVGNGEELFDFGDLQDRALVEVLENAMAVACGAPKIFGDAAPVFFSKSQDATGGFGGFTAGFEHTGNEEVEPAFPVTPVAHGLEAVVILGVVAF